MKRCKCIAILIGLLLTSAFWGQDACAQKIYLLATGDIKDKEIGEADMLDILNVQLAFFSHVPKRQLEVYGDDPRASSIWTGPCLEEAKDMKSAILDAIARCPAGDDDTIVFYWSGHGAFDSKGHFLQMPDRNRLYRKDVVAAIKRKSPNLAVVISDSCNKPVDSEFRDDDPRAIAPTDKEPLRISPLFDSLFMRHTGLLDMNASSEGQVARCFSTCGGLFTSTLTSTQEEYDDTGPTGRGVQIILNTSRRRTVEVPFGYLWTHALEREDWNDLISHVNYTTRKHWPMRDQQTIRVWSLPHKITSPPTDTPDVLRLTRNDVILSINGVKIRDEDDCRREIRDSGKRMTFTVRDSRDGTVWRMETRLRSKAPRFGIYPADARGGGALVTRVRFGSPATHNHVLEKVRQGGGNVPPTLPPGKILSLSRGDVILSVNGRAVNGKDACIKAVNNSPTTMTFTVRDSRDGTVWRMQTKLKSQGQRFGVYLRNARGGGAYVTSVASGSAATHNHVLERVSPGR